MTQQAIDEITLTGVNNRLLSLNHGLMGKALFFYKYAIASTKPTDFSHRS